jgi:hypothetical protein
VPAPGGRASTDVSVAASARRKAYRHVVLPLFVTSTIAYLDRVNISYAALTMNADLGFDPGCSASARASSSRATSCSEVPGP